MKTIIIPTSFGYPTVDVLVNRKRYTLETGKEITVPVAVAEVIENALALQPKTDPNAGSGGGGGRVYHHRVTATFQHMSWDLGMASAFSGHPAPLVAMFDVYSTNPNAFASINDALQVGETVNCTGYTGCDEFDSYERITHCGLNVQGFWIGCYKTFSSGMAAPEFYDIYAADGAVVHISDTVTAL